MSVTVIEGREHDLGNGLLVRRTLPTAACRSIGPFVFLDHAGPIQLHGDAARAADVRPHPHIGLATVSYLLSGAVRHRDNLGSDQIIRPGDVNWMSAGRGIVHSERFDATGAFAGAGLELIQFWVALPEEHEEDAPTFTHTAAAELPHMEDQGIHIRLIAGQAWGLSSPLAVSSPTFYAHIDLKAGACIELPAHYAERGAYVAHGRIRSDANDADYCAHRLLRFSPGGSPELQALEDSTVMLFGGDPIGPRFMWWNFVSSRKERIRAAAADWQAGRFALPASDNRESIPLPRTPNWLTSRVADPGSTA